MPGPEGSKGGRFGGGSRGGGFGCGNNGGNTGGNHNENNHYGNENIICKNKKDCVVVATISSKSKSYN